MATIHEQPRPRVSDLHPEERAAIEGFEQRFDPSRPDVLPGGATLVGFGEISMVFRLEACPGRVFKRVAGLRRGESVAYRQIVEAYVARLDSCGVDVAPVQVLEVERAPGRWITYLAQRALDPARLAHRVAPSASDAELDLLITTILGHADEVLQRGGGFDAQLSNWALARPRAFDELFYLDLTTPMLRVNGHEQLDLGFMMRSLPLPLRVLMRATRADRSMMDRYYTRRMVAMDLVSNLLKEGMGRRLPQAIRSANRWLHRMGDRPLTIAEVRADYARDARMWAFLHWARRQDRWVRTRLLAQTYEWGIAPAIDRSGGTE